MTIDTKPLDPELQELDRVTIRFAGDSGDGMQLTGTQFTRTAAVYGNDISTLPDFPAEIRAPAGSLPGVSGFQISFSSSDIHTPGDQPDVLVAMNPAALKTNVGDLPAGGALIVNSDAFTQAEPQQGRLRGEPADGRLAQAVRALRDPDLDPQRALARRARHDEQAEGPDEELLRPRDHVLALRPGLRGDDPLDRGEVREAAGRRGGEHAGAQGRLRVRRDDRDLPHPLPRRAGPPAARHVSQHHRQRGDGPRHAGRLEAGRPAAVLRLVPDHAGVGHPPPAVGLQELRGQDVPGRGRDRGDRCGDRGELRRGDGDDRIVRVPASPSSPRRSGSRSWSSCRSSSSTSSAPAPRRGCRRRPSRPTCSRSCSGATATRRCRSSRRPPPGSASISRSSRGGSPSST